MTGLVTIMARNVPVDLYGFTGRSLLFIQYLINRFEVKYIE
jgi:hypothetical protein